MRPGTSPSPWRGRSGSWKSGSACRPGWRSSGIVRGTIVSLNWIPLGGFVRPAGEFGGKEPGDFAARPRRVRAAMLAVGPAANLLAGFLVLTVAFVLGGPDEDLARVVDVSPGSPAEAAGVQPGDIVRWRPYPGPNGEPSLSQMFRREAGRPVRFEVERDGVILGIELTPRLHPPQGEGPAGFHSMAVVRPHAPAEAAVRAGEMLTGVFRSTLAAISGEEPARVVGPLGLKQASDQSVQGSIRWSSPFPLLYLAALIQVGLALTNLLPIPALDGGRLLLLGIEGVGVRLSLRLTKILVGASAIGLICLMAALTVRDVLDPLV